jgi:hypothetical protein
MNEPGNSAERRHMHLLRRSSSARIVLLAISFVLVVAVLALPSLAAAGDRNEFIHTTQWFESPALECASGEFEATGVFAATGRARSCARQFSSPSIVRGTTQLHNGDDLTLRWRMQCDDPDGRARHFECKGQWSVDSPNWQGGGNLRAVLDFVAAPYGSIDFTFNGNLTAV